MWENQYDTNFQSGPFSMLQLLLHLLTMLDTLPKTNSRFAPENGPSQKERIVFQPLIFRGYVSFREGINHADNS